MPISQSSSVATLPRRANRKAYVSVMVPPELNRVNASYGPMYVVCVELNASKYSVPAVPFARLDGPSHTSSKR